LHAATFTTANLMINSNHGIHKILKVKLATDFKNEFKWNWYPFKTLTDK